MTRTVAILCLLVACVAMMGAETAQARGLLGTRYGTAQVTLTRPGDSALRAIDNAVWGFNAAVNVPATDRVDVTASVSRRSLEGGGTDIDTAAFVGGVNVAISPLDPVCPFIIGRIGLVDTNPGDTDPLISLGAGVQYDFTEDAALTPSLVFTHVDDYDDVILGLEANYWFTDRVFGIGSIAVGIDDEDLGFMFGAGLEF